VPRVLEQRTRLGLDGLVGGLECVIINTEPERQQAAVHEILRFTGLECTAVFEDEEYRTYILKTPGSADFLIRSRKNPDNPFTPFNLFPRSRHLPNTRLETFVFRTSDLDEYVAIQKARGVRFLTDEILDFGAYTFIQTEPSRFTGNSLGFIQWQNRRRGDYVTAASDVLGISVQKPDLPHLRNIQHLDHAATRLRAQNRDAAIIEFMELTNYTFEFAIYVKVFNSITSVARLSKTDFAMVFTTGIADYVSEAESGPTEKFVHHYGPRVHHLAFQTERIEETYAALRAEGMEFLIDLVGSPAEGLKQTFSQPAEQTLLVNEYIYRYGDFEGFFTRSNVTLLTGATARQ
jgi:4-hydroxyphenylpyruvate dioxygenase-like putative hemolysin